MKWLQQITGAVFGFLLALVLMDRAPAEPPKKPVLRDAPTISVLPGIEEVAPVVDLVPAHEAKAEPATGVPDSAEAAQADSGVESYPPSAPPESVPLDVSQFVHRLVVNGVQSGSCVATGPGSYVTAKHIFQGDDGNYLPLRSVEIAGQMTNAHVNYPGVGDIATIRTDGNFNGVAAFEVQAVEGDRVLVYGTTTATVQHGFIVKDYVQIDETDPGVTQGDSGGGVFTEDGKLLGVISAFYGSRKSGTADQRRVYFESPPSVAVPRITILSPATWDCPHCPGHRNQNWKSAGIDATFEKRDGLPRYPCTEWTDSRGVIRRLYGIRTPNQVRWSWEHAQ